MFRHLGSDGTRAKLDWAADRPAGDLAPLRPNPPPAARLDLRPRRALESTLDWAVESIELQAAVPRIRV
jgi:hypothetical protein